MSPVSQYYNIRICTYFMLSCIVLYTFNCLLDTLLSPGNTHLRIHIVYTKGIKIVNSRLMVVRSQVQTESQTIHTERLPVSPVDVIIISK